MYINYSLLLKYWGLLDLSTELEDTGYIPEGIKVYEAVTDYLIIKETDTKTIVICTGSNTGRSFKTVVEWFTNFTAWSKKGFHRGFYNVAKRMAEQLKDYKWDKSKDVLFICHSRGIYGLILAYMLEKLEVINAPNVISYGAPECCKRGGYKKLSDSNVNHIRVWTQDDVVTKVGAGVHWSTCSIKLPTVKGIDHISYDKALKKAMELDRKADA